MCALGHCLEADTHYGTQLWAMRVTAEGVTTYLQQEGAQTSGGVVAWVVDASWRAAAKQNKVQ